MKAKLLVIFVLCLLSCIANIDDAASDQCKRSDIVVSQAGTGGWAHGQPEYEVTVGNTCACPQTDVTLTCHWFNTTLAVDPAKLRPVDNDNGDLCIVAGGAAVVQGHDVTFRYAWSSQYDFKPATSTVRCD